MTNLLRKMRFLVYFDLDRRTVSYQIYYRLVPAGLQVNAQWYQKENFLFQQAYPACQREFLWLEVEVRSVSIVWSLCDNLNDSYIHFTWNSNS